MTQRNESQEVTIEKKDGITAPSISFVLTGFGPFRGVTNNPTTVIANNITEYLSQKKKVGDNNNDECLMIETTQVIETSADSARREMEDLMKKFQEEEEEQQKDNDSTTMKIIIILHLGVNYMGNNFQLEQFAYNEANFRIPDEKGFQPRNKKVYDEDDNDEDCSSLQTRLDLESIQKHIVTMNCRRNEEEEEPIMISTDPGRFVCNYTYYCSLRNSKEMKHVYPIFVHVPPFSKVPQEEQLEMITKIMTSIRHQILSKY